MIKYYHSYENDNVDILVKTVDHDINLSGWTTKIGTISAPAKKSRNSGKGR